MQRSNDEPTDQTTESAPPIEDPGNAQPALDPKTVFLGGLFALAFPAAVQAASDILLPLAL